MDIKYIYVGYMCVVVVMVVNYGVNGESEEPKCLSRFDHDYKTVQKLFQLEQRITELTESLATSLDHIKDLSSGDVGSVYIRWGRNRCHGNARLVYKGFTAGKKYNDKGSGSDTICLPDDPSWFNYTTGGGSRGYVYGTEIDVSEPSGVFENRVNNKDIPCAACHIRKSTVLMIPGWSHCYTGWKLEYAGYLMTAYHGHDGPHNHVCVDHHPEAIPHGEANNNEHILYLAVSKCGSLPCPPYVDNRELACVVCSI